MEKPVITSTTNPLAKHIKALRQRKQRNELDSFVVEGLHHVGEAVAAGWEIEVIVYAPDVLESTFARALLQENSRTAQPVSSAVMESLADKENPQGILAIIHQRHIQLSELTGLQRIVGLVTPQDPGNVGTVLRTMDAMGADALILVDGGVDPYHPTCVRASMGALFWKPVVQASFLELLDWSTGQGLHLIGTSAHAQADYRSIKPSEPWLLLLGSEQKGLSAEHMAACETSVALRMRGRTSSLNLAVAAGILLYHFSG